MTADVSAQSARSRAADLLASAREQVDQALRDAARDLDEPVREIVSYHFGWTAADGRPHSADCAPVLRAALVLASARAVGGPSGPALAAAAAVELVHHSSLLQHDAMDRDRSRQHRPTAWTVFGESRATLAGDALAVLALSTLLRAGDQPAVAATQLLSRAYQDLVAGQALDIRFRPRSRVSVDEYCRMAEAKTASLLACAASLGAVLADADPAAVGALHTYGRHLGLASRFVDDIQGIWGDPRTTGKPVGWDIRTRRTSLPVAYALSLPEAWRLARFYALTHDPAPEEVQQVAAALAAFGARTWANAKATDHLDAAIDSLRGTGIAPDRQADLIALARFVADRTR